MQRTDRDALGERPVRAARRLERPIGVELHDGVDLRIDLFDPAKVRLDELVGGDVALANEVGELARRAKAEVAVAGLHHPSILSR